MTIVLVGGCTWARKYVDWEVAASLRNTPSASRSGLLAITLPSAENNTDRRLPARVADNVDGKSGYARWWKYPSSASDLAMLIETAYQARSARFDTVDNTRSLRAYNSTC